MTDLRKYEGKVKPYNEANREKKKKKQRKKKQAWRGDAKDRERVITTLTAVKTFI